MIPDHDPKEKTTLNHIPHMYSLYSTIIINYLKINGHLQKRNSHEEERRQLT